MFYLRHICFLPSDLHYFYLVSWRYDIPITVAKENPNYGYFSMCKSKRNSYHLLILAVLTDENPFPDAP